MLRMSSSTDSSASATQIVVESDGVDTGGSGGGKLVKKSSKSRELSKSPKSLKSLESLQKPSVWRNVYQSTYLSSMRYKELELPLEL